VLLVGIATSVAIAGCGHEAPRSRPSIVLVSLDTLRPDHLGCCGYPRATSPTLDAFAAQAVCFPEARCQSAGTLTSHLSLFTSLYPAQLGITRDDGRNATQPTTRLRLSEAIPTLAEILLDAGFETAAFTGGGFVAGRYGFDRGFEVFEEGGQFGGLAEVLPRVAGFLGGRAADPARAARPLFLFVHGYDVHQPYDAPRPYARVFSSWTYDETARFLGHEPVPKLLTLSRERLSATGLATVQALYDNEILAADRLVGRLFAVLERHGLYEDAVVAVLSDHGEEFLEHGGFGHGRTVYEEAVRVPLIVRFPGARNAGRIVVGAVALLDVAPTLLDLAGLPAREEHEGRSLVGLVEGRDGGGWLAGRTLLLDVPDLVPPVQALLAGRWKVIRGGRAAPWELYDLSADPAERRESGGAPDGPGSRLANELLARHRRLSASSRTAGWLAVPQETDEMPPDALGQLRALGYVD
jgi:arylsulfatase A-like enzyme